MSDKMRAEHKLPKQLFIVEAKAIEAVLRRAVNHALLMHKQAGNSIATWKDGKVVLIPPEEIEIPTDTFIDEN
ncbi:MAG: hypothetical protein QOJ02_720 [Acidobacteriota bacterium]|jgi:hypothetical protein|nr:hypothetical protein [Acidobacteriota bacterium]